MLNIKAKEVAPIVEQPADISACQNVAGHNAGGCSGVKLGSWI